MQQHPLVFTQPSPCCPIYSRFDCLNGKRTKEFVVMCNLNGTINLCAKLPKNECIFRRTWLDFVIVMATVFCFGDEDGHFITKRVVEGLD